jgi:bifunctional enzyme CysN/CysC
MGGDDRSENLRRSAEVARILNDTGVICIAAFVAPHDAVRQKVRQVIGPDRFFEVYLTAPLEVLKSRDKSGAYEAAEEGKIAQFPGVSASFEEPTNADLVLETDKLSVEDCVEHIVAGISGRGLLPK